VSVTRQSFSEAVCAKKVDFGLHLTSCFKVSVAKLTQDVVRVSTHIHFLRNKSLGVVATQEVSDKTPECISVRDIFCASVLALRCQCIHTVVVYVRHSNMSEHYILTSVH
jgi:hypothetical protein